MRTRRSIINVAIGMLSQVVIALLGLVSRNYFMNYLGADIAGLNNTFNNIVSMLALTELGIGTAIIVNLYKPLAEDDHPKIIALMQLYQKLYRIFSIVILGLGLIIAPFVQFILKAEDRANFTFWYLFGVFMLFVIDLASSYLMAYKRSIIIADQQNFIITIINTLVSVLMYALQIFFLIRTGNFVVFLVIKISCRLIENIIITLIANKKYPYLLTKEKYKVESSVMQNIITNVKSLAMHYIGNYLINSVDNLIITKMLKLAVSGVYSNYSLVITLLKNVLIQFANNITASLGNLLTENDDKHLYRTFNKVLFVSFVLSNFVFVSLICLFNPFIEVWISKAGMTFSFSVVLLISLNFYITILVEPFSSVRAAAGIFHPDRYLHIILAALNLVLSVLLVKIIGIAGVFVGTLVCHVIKELTVLPMICYRRIFHRSMKEYYKQIGIYLGVTAVCALVTGWLCSLIALSNGWVSLIAKAVVCLIVPNVIVIILFHRTDDFQYLWQLVRNMVHKLKNRNKPAAERGAE